MSALDRARDASERLARFDMQRDQLVAERDAAMAEAKAAGATWDDLQRATGLNPNAVRKALARHRNR